MPGKRCSVTTCNNCYQKTKTLVKTISYHRFPKIPALRMEWIVKCHRDEKWNSDNHYVCSEHFSDDDYEQDLHAELLGFNYRKILKSDSIPSLLLPTSKQFTPSAIAKQNRMKTKLEQMRHQHRLKELQTLLEKPKPNPSIDYKELYEKSQKECSSHKATINSLTKSNMALKSELETARAANEELIKDKVKELLSQYLSESQINLLLNKQKQVKWSPQEFTKALSLLSLSKEAYLFIHKEMNYPLPGLSSLRRWVASVKDAVLESPTGSVIVDDLFK